MTGMESSTIHGLSFPTDLLFNLDAVRKHCTISLTTHQACLTMIKGRIQLEQYYATELARLADQFKVDSDSNDSSHEIPWTSSLKEAFFGLKAQYMNTSVQHKALAGNIEDDVYRPMDNLYKYLTKRENKLNVCTSRVRKQTKAFEDHYRKQQYRFDKQFKEASTTFAQALEVGIVPEIIQYQYQSSPVHAKGIEKNMKSLIAPLVSQEQHISVSEIKARQRRNSMSAATPTRASLDSSKLVSWLLPNEQQKKDNLLLNSVKAIENAEISRQECRQAWLGFQEARIALFRSIQSILNDYQHMTEYRIANLTSSLRKHVIFESSSLANSQYDWQMLASVLEAVDTESDLRNFILAHQRMVLPHMTVNDLCRVDSLPLPPVAKSVEMQDITNRKFPVDSKGNPMVVYGWLATRPSTYELDFTTAPVILSSITAKALVAALEIVVDGGEKPEFDTNDSKEPALDANENELDSREPEAPTTSLEDKC